MDLLNAIQALSQLSYDPVFTMFFGARAPKRAFSYRLLVPGATAFDAADIFS